MSEAVNSVGALGGHPYGQKPEQKQDGATLLGHGTQETAITRQKILRDAEKYVMKNRNSVYGSPEDNFQNTADLINVQFRHKISAPFTASDVAILMICLKLARLKTSPDHYDTWVDVAGYAACGAECEI